MNRPKSFLTTVRILTNNDEWLASKGYTLRDLRKQLEEEFGGKFKILNKGSHQVTNSTNLKSEVVEKTLREFIVENGKEWDLSEVLFSADIESQAFITLLEG